MSRTLTITGSEARSKVLSLNAVGDLLGLAFKIASGVVCLLEGDQAVSEFFAQVGGKSLSEFADHVIGQIEVGFVGHALPFINGIA